MKTIILQLLLVLSIFPVAFGQLTVPQGLELKDSLYYDDIGLFSGYFEQYDNRGHTMTGCITEGLIDSILIYNNKMDIVEIHWFNNNQQTRMRKYSYGIGTTVSNYKGGKLDGPWERYFANSKLKEKGYYRQDIPTGYWEQWDRKGRIIAESDLTPDSIVIQKFHDYKWGKHRVLIREYDKINKKNVSKEKFKEKKR